jgi:hypothetical protein
MDYKKIFDKFEDENVFIKTTVQPFMDSAQKAALNRKANVLYNSGDVEGARRIFMATGYSDGLCRIGDYYKSQNRLVEALHMYWIAPDRTKAEPLIMQAALIIQGLVSETTDTSPIDNITTSSVSIINEKEGHSDD